MPDGKAQIEMGELGKPHGYQNNVTKSLPLLGSTYRLGINVFTGIGYDQHVKEGLQTVQLTETSSCPDDTAHCHR